MQPGDQTHDSWPDNQHLYFPFGYRGNKNFGFSETIVDHGQVKNWSNNTILGILTAHLGLSQSLGHNICQPNLSHLLIME